MNTVHSEIWNNVKKSNQSIILWNDKCVHFLNQKKYKTVFWKETGEKNSKMTLFDRNVKSILWWKLCLCTKKFNEHLIVFCFCFSFFWVWGVSYDDDDDNFGQW